MLLVAHCERQLDLGLTDRELHSLAMVLDRLLRARVAR